MRILQLLAPAPMGGLESVVYGLAQGLAARGHHIHVGSIIAGTSARHPFLAALSDVSVPYTVIQSHGRRYWLDERSVSTLIRTHRPNVVHTHGYHAGLAAIRPARAVGARLVATVHGFTGGRLRNKVYEELLLLAMRRYDAVIAVSDPLHQMLLHRAGRMTRVEFIANAWTGAPPETRPNARRILGIEDDVNIAIAWVGRLSPEKDPEAALRALALLEGIPATLNFIGEGPEQDRLRSLTHDLGLTGKVRWLGRVQNAGVYISAFDMLVLSSRTEGTPIVLLEAAAAKVPIVATDVGGVRHLTGGDGAMLVRPSDPVALADGVRAALLDNVSTQRRIVAMTARLQAHFTAKIWLDEHERVYTGRG
jgi:glycosyltransferase involved in cell wall biosynthesis